MKPKLPWYVHLLLSLATKFLPEPVAKVLAALLDAYDKLPEEKMEAAKVEAVGVLKKHCSGTGCPADTVGE